MRELNFEDCAVYVCSSQSRLDRLRRPGTTTNRQKSTPDTSGKLSGALFQSKARESQTKLTTARQLVHPHRGEFKMSSGAYGVGTFRSNSP